MTTLNDYRLAPTVHAAKVVLPLHELAYLIGLPDNLHAAHLVAVMDPPAVHVVVQGDHLPPTLQNCELPVLPGAWEREVIVHNGRPYTRWSWGPDDPPTATPLQAAASRLVWDDEAADDTLYIQGHNYTDAQIHALIDAWVTYTDPTATREVISYQEDTYDDRLWAGNPVTVVTTRHTD